VINQRIHLKIIAFLAVISFTVTNTIGYADIEVSFPAASEAVSHLSARLLAHSSPATIRSELRVNELAGEGKTKDQGTLFTKQVLQLAAQGKDPTSIEDDLDKQRIHWFNFRAQYPHLNQLFGHREIDGILIRATIETKQTLSQLDEEARQILQNPILTAYVTQNPLHAFYQDYLTQAFLVSQEARDAFLHFAKALEAFDKHPKAFLMSKRLRQPVAIFLASPRTRHATAQFLNHFVADAAWAHPDVEGTGKIAYGPLMRDESNQVSFFWYYLTPIFEQLRNMGRSEEQAAKLLLYFHNHFYKILQEGRIGEPMYAWGNYEWRDWLNGKETIDQFVVEKVAEAIVKYHDERETNVSPQSSSADRVAMLEGRIYDPAVIKKEKTRSMETPTVVFDLDRTLAYIKGDYPVLTLRDLEKAVFVLRDGVEAELLKLRTNGIRLVLWTSAIEDYAKAFFRQHPLIARLFDAAITRENYAEPTENELRATYGAVDFQQVRSLYETEPHVKDIDLLGYQVIVDDTPVLEALTERLPRLGQGRQLKVKPLGDFSKRAKIDLSATGWADHVLKLLHDGQGRAELRRFETDSESVFGRDAVTTADLDDVVIDWIAALPENEQDAYIKLWKNLLRDDDLIDALNEGNQNRVLVILKAHMNDNVGTYLMFYPIAMIFGLALHGVLQGAGNSPTQGWIAVVLVMGFLALSWAALEIFFAEFRQINPRIQNLRSIIMSVQTGHASRTELRAELPRVKMLFTEYENAFTAITERYPDLTYQKIKSELAQVEDIAQVILARRPHDPLNGDLYRVIPAEALHQGQRRSYANEWLIHFVPASNTVSFRLANQLLAVSSLAAHLDQLRPDVPYGAYEVVFDTLPSREQVDGWTKAEAPFFAPGFEEDLQVVLQNQIEQFFLFGDEIIPGRLTPVWLNATRFPKLQFSIAVLPAGKGFIFRVDRVIHLQAGEKKTTGINGYFQPITQHPGTRNELRAEPNESSQPKLIPRKGYFILNGGQQGHGSSSSGLLDVLTAERELTGRQASKQDVHRQGEWHQTAHIHMSDQHRRILVQERSAHESESAGKLQVAVSGHVDAGETPKQAALREAAEEIGIQLDSNRLIQMSRDLEIKRSYPIEGGLNNEFTTVFYYQAADEELEQIRTAFNLNEITRMHLIPIEEFEAQVLAENVAPAQPGSSIQTRFSRSIRYMLTEGSGIWRQISNQVGKHSELRREVNFVKNDHVDLSPDRFMFESHHRSELRSQAAQSMQTPTERELAVDLSSTKRVHFSDADSVRRNFIQFIRAKRSIAWKTSSFGQAEGYLDYDFSMFPGAGHFDKLVVHVNVDDWAGKHPKLRPLYDESFYRDRPAKPPVGSFGQLLIEFPLGIDQQWSGGRFVPTMIVRVIQSSDGFHRLNHNQRKQLFQWIDATMQILLDWASLAGVNIFVTTAPVLQKERKLRQRTPISDYEKQHHLEYPFQNSFWERLELPSTSDDSGQYSVYNFFPDITRSTRQMFPWHVFAGNPDFNPGFFRSELRSTIAETGLALTNSQLTLPSNRPTVVYPFQGSQLRDRRLAARISTQAITQGTGVSPKQYPRIEKGTKPVSAQRLKVLHDYIDQHQGQILHDRRLVARLTQNEVAQETNRLIKEKNMMGDLHATQGFISRVERGGFIRIDMLKVLHEAIDNLQGERLRERKTAARISNRVLAEAAGTSESIISLIENGKRGRYGSDALLKLHEAIDKLEGPILRERRQKARLLAKDIVIGSKYRIGFIHQFERGRARMNPKELTQLHHQIDVAQGSKLRESRLLARLSSKKLALEAGVNPNYLSDIERGAASKDPVGLAKLQETIDRLQGPILRKRRQEARLTLRDVASQSKLSASFINSVESGEKPRQTSLARLHQAVDDLQGPRLKQRRIAAELSVKHLAALAEVDPSYVYYLEAGKASKNPEDLVWLHLAVDAFLSMKTKRPLRLDWLFGWEDDLNGDPKGAVSVDLAIENEQKAILKKAYEEVITQISDPRIEDVLGLFLRGQSPDLIALALNLEPDEVIRILTDGITQIWQILNPYEKPDEIEQNFSSMIMQRTELRHLRYDAVDDTGSILKIEVPPQAIAQFRQTLADRGAHFAGQPIRRELRFQLNDQASAESAQGFIVANGFMRDFNALLVPLAEGLNHLPLIAVVTQKAEREFVEIANQFLQKRYPTLRPEQLIHIADSYQEAKHLLDQTGSRIISVIGAKDDADLKGLLLRESVISDPQDLIIIRDIEDFERRFGMTVEEQVVREGRLAYELAISA